MATMKKLLRALPGMGKLERMRAALREPLPRYPAGHFYSPMPDQADVDRRAGKLWGLPSKLLGGIDLNEAGQQALFEQLAAFYPEMPFPVTAPEAASAGLRYYLENDYCTRGDGVILYSLLRHLKPKRIVEVGSGFSSAVMLDTRDKFLGPDVRCTFIEPYPDRLLSLLRPADHATVTLLKQPVQDVDPAVFTSLEANDILFVDSSHVSKAGSDVNSIVFDILPTLKPGVWVHFHDVFYPFEYPRAWIKEGRAWNEDYLLRAFLQYNAAFKIEFFNAYWYQFHLEQLAKVMPAATRAGYVGGSIWLQKTA
jgi:predicted O-methyltransferase YrrM